MRAIKNLVRSSIGLRNDTDFYSQCGEDAVVMSIFSNVVEPRSKFYIDIGAYHPFKHSNTYLLSKAGWRGINIDPRPGSKALFDKYRPNDSNIEAGIAAEEGSMSYYVIGEESTMNTFSRENLERLGILDRVIRTIDVPVLTLESVLLKHPDVTKVDYLNVDAEGFELEIIQGLAFWPIKPILVSIEQNGTFTLADVLRSDTCSIMESSGYSPVGKNVILPNVATVFYLRSELL